MRRSCFSPLFIGELSSTRSLQRIGWSGRWFQSPLHRGTLFNSPRSHRPRGRSHVSVPSSSGNSLQRFIDPALHLIIGVSVPSSSGNSLQPALAVHAGITTTVSVPSSSGNSLQQRHPGELRPQAHVSVPSSSGNSLQLADSRSEVAGLFVSVPSSSGNSLQHSEGLLNRPCRSGFSPLFIGELSSTTSSAFLARTRRVSVPSSSGNSLQQL